MSFFFCRKHIPTRNLEIVDWTRAEKLYIYILIYCVFLFHYRTFQEKRCRGRDHLEKLIDIFSISAINYMFIITYIYLLGIIAVCEVSLKKILFHLFLPSIHDHCVKTFALSTIRQCF